MNDFLDRSISICNRIINLFEDDYRELHKSLQGEIYEEYKILMQDEIERVERIRQEIEQVK